MADNEYHFSSQWRVRGSPEEVYNILKDPNDLVRWWPAVYLDVTELEDREPVHGRGQEQDSVYDLHTAGWLPYTLRWQLHPAERTPPERIELEARGDLVGRGVWTISADGPWVDISFEWRVRAEKPLLRALSFMVGPIFAANHRWAMAKGEESLRLELARRHTPTEKARARLPAPPKSIISLSIPLVGMLMLAFAIVYGHIRFRSDSSP